MRRQTQATGGQKKKSAVAALSSARIHGSRRARCASSWHTAADQAGDAGSSQAGTTRSDRQQPTRYGLDASGESRRVGSRDGTARPMRRARRSSCAAVSAGASGSARTRRRRSRWPTVRRAAMVASAAR
jgi:hypothetical protein